MKEKINSFKRVVLIIMLGWLSMIGFDFFLHAGVLAKYYLMPSPFLLSPEKAFQLIPIGYLSFVLLSILLVWLELKLKINLWKNGLIFGLTLGGLTWGAVILGLISISTASIPLLIGWLFGQTIELGIAGMFTARALGGKSLKRLFIEVIAMIFIFLIITVVLQNLGLSPSMRTR